MDFSEQECRKKSRQWWIVVSVILVFVTLLWTLVIFYLLSPHSETILNRQVLSVNPQGETSLLLLTKHDESLSSSSSQAKFLRKQEFVHIYDLRERRWKTKTHDTCAVIPSFRTNQTFYLLHYCPKKKDFSQIEYRNTETILITPHVYRPWSYFFREFGTYLGLYPKSKSRHHVFTPI